MSDPSPATNPSPDCQTPSHQKNCETTVEGLSFEEVQSLEHKLIDKRRDVFRADADSETAEEDAGKSTIKFSGSDTLDDSVEPKQSPAASAAKQSNAEQPENLVGLALSGGGLRSAIFNLGVIQAFLHRGLMKQVDYISSVSGGGYAAGFLAERATRFYQDGHVSKDSLPDNDNESDKKSVLEEKTGTEQTVPAETTNPDSDREVAKAWWNFSRRLKDHRQHPALLDIDPETQKLDKSSPIRSIGAYLEYFFQAFWIYVGSTIKMLLLFTSAFGIIAASAALVWRCLDYPGFRNLLRANSYVWYFGEDFVAAFLPAVGVTLVFLFLLVGRFAILHNKKKYYACLATILSITGLMTAWLWIQIGTFEFTEQYYRVFTPLFLGLLWCAYLIRSRYVNLDSHVPPEESTDDQRRKHCWKLSEKHERRIRLWAKIMVAAYVMSVAVFLGNSDTAFFSLTAQSFDLNYFLPYLTVAGILIQGAVVWARSSLLKSAATETPDWQSSFAHGVFVLVTLAPLFVICHWMARENISGYTKYRNYEFHESGNEIRRWDRFLSMLEGGADPLTPPNDEGETKDGKIPSNRSEIVKEHLKKERKLSEIKSERNAQSYAENQRHGVLSSTRRIMSSLVTTATTKAEESADSAGFFGFYDGGREYSIWRSTLGDRERYITEFNKYMIMPECTDRLVSLIASRYRQDWYDVGPTELPSQSSNNEERTKLPKLEIVTHLLNSHENDGTKLSTSVRSKTKLGNLDTQDWNRLNEFWRLHRAYKERLATESGNKNVERELTKDEYGNLNRGLMEFGFRDLVMSRRFETTSLLPLVDQPKRFAWLITWVVIFVVLSLVVDFNNNCPFYWFYRQRIDRCLVQHSGSKYDFNRETHLANLKTCELGMPLHLFVGNIMLRRKRQKSDSHSQSRPHSFILSQVACGTPEEKMWRSGYTNVNKLIDAVTISGSAVTPLMTSNFYYSVLMTALNLRLGRWIRNPVQTASDDKNWFSRLVSRISKLPFVGRPGFWHIARELFKRDGYSTKMDDWEYGFVADGGFRDFLGVEELLRRRCKLVIVSDAGSQAGTNELSSLAKMIRIARTGLGIEFLDLDHERELDVTRLKRIRGDAEGSDGSAAQRVRQQFICGRIRYHATEEHPEPEEGYLVYMQMSLTGREDIDLQQFRNLHPNFPDEPIRNQFFSEDQVESYRQLGHHIASIVCDELPKRKPSRQSGPLPEPLEFDQLAENLLSAYVRECYREGVDLEDVMPSALVHQSLYHFDDNEQHWPNKNSKLTVGYAKKIIRNADRYITDYVHSADVRRKFHSRPVDIQNNLADFRDLLKKDDSPNKEEIERVGTEIGKIAIQILLDRGHYPIADSNDVFQVNGRKRLLERLLSLFVTNPNGVLSAFESETGTDLSPERKAFAAQLNEICKDTLIKADSVYDTKPMMIPPSVEQEPSFTPASVEKESVDEKPVEMEGVQKKGRGIHASRPK